MWFVTKTSHFFVFVDREPYTYLLSGFHFAISCFVIKSCQFPLSTAKYRLNNCQAVVRQSSGSRQKVIDNIYFTLVLNLPCSRSLEKLFMALFKRSLLIFKELQIGFFDKNKHSYVLAFLFTTEKKIKTKSKLRDFFFLRILRFRIGCLTSYIFWEKATFVFCDFLQIDRFSIGSNTFHIGANSAILNTDGWYIGRISHHLERLE